LLPGLLKTVCANKHVPLPIKVFEVSDVVLKDESMERRARNQRNVAAVFCSKTSGFEVRGLFSGIFIKIGNSLKFPWIKLVHGLMDRIMMMLNVPLVAKGESEGYYIKESCSNIFNIFLTLYFFSWRESYELFDKDETYFPDRRADVFYKNQLVGSFGIMHPQVLEKFEIGYPCSGLELNLEPFV
jgi:phenylalanyl-tRNA synthetase beta chain